MRIAAKSYLWLMILMSLAFGLLYLFVPAKMIEPLGYGALVSSALADIRTTFAAFQLATAIFLVWCVQTEQIKLGLICMFFSGLAFVLCRGYGLYIDHSLTPMLRGTIIFELALTVISIVLYALTPEGGRIDAGPSKRAATIFVAVMGLATFASGLASALMPVETLAPMGFSQLAPSALTDARASYGGFQIGLALFMLWCLPARHVFAGAFNFFICIALIVICRALAMVIDNIYTQSLIGALIFESVLAALALFAVLKARKFDSVAS